VFTPRRTLISSCLVGLSSIGLATGCGGSSAGPVSSTPSSAAGTGTAVITAPADIANRGSIAWCTDPTLGPPASYLTPSKDHVGSDMEIARTISELVGVKADIQTISFNTTIPSIQSGKCDAYIGGITNTADRARQVHFTNYAKVGDQLLVSKGNPKGITSVEALSGHSVAVVLGTTEQAHLQQVNAELKKQGKAPITIRVFQEGTAANQALQTNQVDAVDQSFPALLAFIRNRPDAFAFGLPTQVNTAPWAIASRKDATDFNAVLARAVDKMYEDGSMSAVLEKSGLGDTALKR
jgi:polar amino acid transport system substrate-binding protein